MQRIAIVMAVVALGLGTYLIAAADGDDTGGKDKGTAKKSDGTTDPKGDAKPDAAGDASSGAAKDKPAAPETPPVVNEKTFHERLLGIAAAYVEYGRIDDTSRWAPTLCRRPPPTSIVHSKSADKATHGRKLYFLYAKDREAYVSPNLKQPYAIGTTIVKEAYLPELVPAKDVKALKAKPVPYSEAKMHADRDGKTYRATKVSGLFVMTKLAPKTDKTDGGWIYGTLTADGKKVTSAGKVGSCMGCHTRGTHDRLFGIQK